MTELTPTTLIGALLLDFETIGRKTRIAVTLDL